MRFEGVPVAYDLWQLAYPSTAAEQAILFMNQENLTRIGIIGSGYIARGLVQLLARQADLTLTRVLTRRDRTSCGDFPQPATLTNSIQALIDESDLVVECSGDVLHGTAMLEKVMAAGLPVVTMDAELQVTTGSYFVDKGFITEAEGDQPGCLAALHEEALMMGFRPRVYGNIKGFLNNNPTPDEMVYWSRKQGISIHQVTAATDGTKVQFEQALVANGLGAEILQPGLSYIAAETLQAGANLLAAQAEQLGQPISDCLLSSPPPAPKLPAGVFLAATHDAEQQDALRYYKMGDGPYYTLLRPYYLPHLEIPKTIRRVLRGEGALLTNSAVPRIGVVAVAKRDLKIGEEIPYGLGSFAVRGIAVRLADYPNYLPIGLMQQVVMRRAVAAEALLTFDDVELPDSTALRAWRAIEERIHRQAVNGG